MAKPEKIIVEVPDFEGAKTFHKQGILPVQPLEREYLDGNGKKQKVMYLYLRGDYSTAPTMSPKQYGLSLGMKRSNSRKLNRNGRFVRC